MPSIQIGRVGLMGKTLNVSEQAGGVVTVSGQTALGTVEEGLTIRQQLLGYSSVADESFVPVTWANFPHLDGYYTVTDVNVGMPPDTTHLGILPWSVTLTPVQGYAAPLIEDTVLGAVRANSLSVVGFIPCVGVPSGVESLMLTKTDLGNAQSGVTPDFVRTGETSSALACAVGGSASMTYSYFLPPALAYDAAVTLQMGDPSRVVVGRQVQNIADTWLLSNDLFQLRPSFATQFDLQFRMWVAASSAWSPWETMTIQYGPSSAPASAPHTITVLRNSPEVVTIRLLAAVDRDPIVIDLTLRRGSRHIATVFSQVRGAVASAKFTHFGSATATTPPGWKQTTSGVTIFCATTAAANSPSLTLGFSPFVTVPSWQYCFGLTDSIVTGSRTDDAERSINEYYYAGNEKLSVVAQ